MAGRDLSTKRVLLTGHFSTIGDIESLDIVRCWLDGIGLSYDVAPFKKSVRKKMRKVCDLDSVDPNIYSHMVMICGPVWKEQLEEIEFDFSLFQNCVCIGVNLTLVTPLQTWNPFDALFERDSDRQTRPDLTLLADTGLVPVVGRCMVQKQSSYTGRERHDEVIRHFDALIQRRRFAVIDLDTRWYLDKNSLQSPIHFLSVLQRVDLLLTNRLHGMVYALKAGVPVIAVDAIEGGAKVSAQAKKLGWPQSIPIENLTPERLDAAVDWCFSTQARKIALSCRERALPELRDVKREFITAVTAEITSSPLSALSVANRTTRFNKTE